VNDVLLEGRVIQQGVEKRERDRAQRRQQQKRGGRPGGGGDEGADEDMGRGAVHEYLTNLTERIKIHWDRSNEWPTIPLLGRPLPFWVPPPDHRTACLELTPDNCYLPTVFFWLPWLWARDQCGHAPSCPECSKELQHWGFTRKRVLTFDMTSTWCISKRFICHNCTSCQAGTSSRVWQGWDPKIREGLPSGIQSIFAFHVERKALIDVRLTDELTCLVLNRTSIAAYASLLQERAMRVYLSLEVDWKLRLFAAKSARPPQHPFEDKVNADGPGNPPPLPPQVVDFSDFGDESGYCGWYPKQKMLQRLLRAELERLEKLWTREIQMVGGQILKGDHSRKTAKLIRLKGTRVFKAVYSLMNEYNQICGIWFCTGESTDELRGVLGGVAERYKMHGLAGPLLFYTDSCCKERVFLKSVFRTLDRGGVRVVHPELPVLDKSILDLSITYVRDKDTTDQICAQIVSETPERVGLDIEYTNTANVVYEGDGLTATVQIAWGKKVYVFHIARMHDTNGNRHFVPVKLKELLEHPGILKCGVGIAGDRTHLRKVGVSMPAAALEDIGQVFTKLGYVDRAGGLNDMAKLLLGHKMVKTLACSHWDGRPNASSNVPLLSQELIDYAGLDAGASLHIAEKLQEIQDKLPTTFSVNDNVVLFDTSGTRRLAFGKIKKLEVRGKPNYFVIDMGRVFIKSHKIDREQGATFANTTFTTLGDMVKHFSGNDPAACQANFNLWWDKRNLRHRVMSLEHDLEPRDAGEDGDAAERVNDWTGETVKLDVLHWFMRISELIKKAHGLRKSFLIALRDAVFAVNPAHREAWRTQRREKLQKKNVHPDKIEGQLDREYSRMLQSCRRGIPPPEELRSAVSKVFDTYGYALDHKTQQPLFSQDVWDVIDAGYTHIEQGCMSDHPDVELYFTDANNDHSPLRCARGTSQLEGFHLWLRQALAGPNTSPVMAMHIILGVSHVWNNKMGITHRGETNFRTIDKHLLLRLKDIDSLLEIEESKYKSLVNPNDFCDTKERFCLMQVTEEQRVELDDPLSEAHDSDDGAESADGGEGRINSDGDDSDKDDVDAAPPRTPAFRVTAAEERMNKILGVPSNVPILLPGRPTPDEEQLYKSLVPDSVDSGGTGINPRKMLGLWCAAVKANQQKRLADRKQIRRANLESIVQLREKMQGRNNQALSAHAMNGADRELSQELRSHRPDISFQRPVPPATPPLARPASLPSQEALSRSQFYIPLPNAGEGSGWGRGLRFGTGFALLPPKVVIVVCHWGCCSKICCHTSCQTESQ